MPESTARHIAYDLRPSKQIERRAIVEFLNCAKNAGFNIPNYRYVGFGGTKFIDFQLMDRYVGFKKYHSIEHDEALFYRCEFNKPLSNIEMFCGPVSNFLALDSSTDNSVYWLDFEKGISIELFSDLNSVASKIMHGDILLTTISAELLPGMVKADRQHRRNILKSRLPAFKVMIDKLDLEKFDERYFSKTVGLMLLTMLKSAFLARHSEGRFHPMFKVIYKDSKWMCTVGGAFTSLRSKQGGKMKRALEISLSTMCPSKPYEFYQIPQFNFTQLEQLLLEKSVVSQNLGYTRRLTRLGFDKNELEAYSKISRFIPKFVESAF